MSNSLKKPLSLRTQKFAQRCTHPLTSRLPDSEPKELFRTLSRGQLRLKPMKSHTRSDISPQVTQIPSFSEVRVSALACVSRMGQSVSRVKKHNQDAYVACPSYKGNKELHLFAVFDGHGEDGHKVTAYLKGVFPLAVESIALSYLSGYLSANEFKQALRSVFLHVQEDLCTQLGVDTEASGSTAVLAIILRDELFCASVGDSRAVLGVKSRPWQVLPLTHDHRPESPREKARITHKHGRIEPNCLPDKAGFGPMRVWLPYRSAPGLAMSRSLGDAEVHEYGVSAEPDISYRKLRLNDRLLLLASDGIWNCVSNEEAVALSFRFYEKRAASQAAESLVTEATRRWKQESESVDDITVVTVFIN